VRPAGTAPYPRPLAHSDYLEEVTVDNIESSAPAHPSTEDQDHPHACLNGYIYLGYTVFDEETGEEVEQVEAVLCRRCLGNS
jgi:hypothetical protein